ncbi:MAG: peptide deformylase [Thermodesulfobacteriota bacterium]|nr:peptide deformylase [Thermodesulfobacteriota bacterium]
MAVLPILMYPDPILTTEAESIEEINDDIRTLARDMIDTMIDAPGSGLAAPQVGSGLRLIVVDGGGQDSHGGKDNALAIINPEIVRAEGELLYEEACLSVLDYSAKVKRAAAVKVKGLDLDGNPVEIEAEGRLAVVFQHEIDHTHGTLFIDRISHLKRDLYRRKLKKILKNKQQAA